MYNVILSHEAEKTYKRLAVTKHALFRRIDTVLLDLKLNPQRGKPLRGKLESKYSLRVGVYRIIYSVFKDKLLIWILDIAHRREAYR